MLKSATYYRARETAREQAIDGVPLATFSRRAAGFGIDFVLVSLLRKPIELLWENHVPHEWERHTLINPVHVLDVIVLVLYFCLALYIGNGQTIGKRVMRIRVVSLTHERITLWQALERALGYGASFLEAGFGFAQFFIQRNRQCAHDRLAETIVINAGKAAARRVDPQEPEPEPQPQPQPSNAAPQESVDHPETARPEGRP
jgi:uncharacterized RDD family membrane protein YckC